MDGIYDVLLDGQPVGKMEVSREGLYYRFRCRCKLSLESICKVQWGEVPIGILVPGENGFELDMKLPAKRYSQTDAVFSVIPNRVVLKGKFVPIRPEEPFAYLERLKEAYFIQRNGQIGIVIEEKAGI